MKLEISFSFFLLLFFALFFTPLSLLFCMLSAAAVHEAGHLLLLSHFGVRVRRIRLCFSGAVIDAPEVARLSYGKELLVTLGGVVSNVLAALFSAAVARYFAVSPLYVFSGANALLALYNLLPVPPLDGAHALWLVAAYFLSPAPADALSAAVGLLVSAALLALGVYVSLGMGAGFLFLLAALFIFLGLLRQLALARGTGKV